MLTIVGCGGSDNPPVKRDAGPDGPVTLDGPKAGTATASPALIDFGTVEVGTPSTPQSVTVTVAGGQVVINPTISGGPGFTIASNTCQATQSTGSCTITVKFTPGSTAGVSGTLSLGAGTTAQVTLSGSGVLPGTFTVTPDSVGLGTLSVGQAATATITVTPQGSIPSIGCTPSGADLTAGGTTCPTTGAVSSACTFSFNFKATTAGSKSDTITCTGGGKTVLTPVTATVVTPPQLLIQPNPASFTAPVGTTDTSQVTVVNNGGSPTAVLTPTITPAGTPFTVASSDCVALASLAACHIQIAFAPTAATAAGTPATATLTVSDGTVQGTVSLSGSAPAAATVTISPNPSDFGSTTVGVASQPTTFTMKNSGGTPTAALTVSSASTEFVVSNDLCSGTTLAASGTCTFAVTFTPSSAGAKSANISATQAGGTLVAGAKVTGTATAAVAPVLSMTPPTLDFGTIGVGTNSAPQTFTVTNSGTGPSAALSVVKKDSTSSSGGAAQFSYTTTCSAVLAAGASCQVVVTYAPTLQGNASATITVTDGAVSTPAGTVVGSALNGVVPGVTCASGFPDTIVGKTATVTCTVKNNLTTGSQSTGAITLTVTGDYSIPAAANTCTASLAPQGTCTFGLVFAPTAKGARTGVLTTSTASGGVTNQTITANGLLKLELQELTGASCVITAGVPTNCTAVATQPFDFTQVSVGSTSPNLTVAVYVRDATVGSLTVATSAAFATPANFVISGGTCPTSGTTPITAANVDLAKAYCYYTLQFTPKSKTVLNGTLTVTGADNSTDSAAVTGTGTGPLTITPAPVAFATVSTGSNAVMTVTLTNNSSTLDVSALHVALVPGAGTAATEFVLSNDGITGQSIAHGGATKTLTVTFAPATVGTKTATLTITGTDTSGSETATVAISGTAGTPAGLTAAITTPIPTTALNGIGLFTVTVTNGGGAASGNITATVAGNQFTLTPPTGQSRGTCGNNATGDTPLTAGATCTINAWFKPTSASGLGVGARTSTLTVTASPGGSAQVALSATPTPELTISPAAIQDFGTVLLSTPSASITFTVTNNSAASATPTVASIANVNSLTPSAQADFHVASNTCSAGLQGLGGTCTFVVSMTPTTRGIRYATLRVTDTTTAQTADVDVKGTGASPANLAFTTATGRDWNFGQVPLNTTSATVTYTLTNTGDVNSGTLAWALKDHVGGATHPKTADFVSTGTTCPTDSGLAPAATCNLVIAFSPTSCAGTSCTTTTTVDVDLVVTSNPGAPTAGVPANSSSAAVPELKGSATANAGSPTLIENSTGKSPYVYPAIGSAASLSATLTFSAGSSAATITGISFADITANGAVSAGCHTGGTCEFTVTNNTCGTGVAANGNCTFTAVWTPSSLAAGPRQVVVSVDGTTATAVLVATKPAPVSLTAAPDTSSTAYAFGTIIQGQPAATTFTVTNNGGIPTSGNLIASATAGTTGDVAIAATGCNAGAPLGAGASCVLSLTVTPGAAEVGNQTATVTVAVVGAGSINVPIALAWTTVATAKLNITPSPIDFTATAVSVGAASAVATIAITAGTNSIISGPLNISVDDANFTVVAVDPAGADADDCANFTAGLGVNAAGTQGPSCNVFVTFKPIALTPTAKQGHLNVTSTSGASATAVLLGTAKAALSVAPATKTFPATGTTVVGSAVTGHTTQNFVFTNNGAPTTGLLTAGVSGTNAAEFVITADGCTGQTLVQAGQCTVTVRFDPTTAGTGKTATLTVSGTPGDSAAAALTGNASST